MFKSIRLFFIMILSIICVYAINRKPTFIGYSNEFTLYVQSNSSNCVFRRVNSFGYLFNVNVFGESCKVEKSAFILDDFLDKFSAQIVLVEEVDGLTSYYAYSKDIRYLQVINGKKVNLHVAVGENTVTLATPVVYGSF